MKKFFLVFAILFAGMLFAEETVLFNASALNSASVEEYSFENWEVVPQSSLSARTQIKMTDKGLGVCVELPKRFTRKKEKIRIQYRVDAQGGRKQ